MNFIKCFVKFRIPLFSFLGQSLAGLQIVHFVFDSLFVFQRKFEKLCIFLSVYVAKCGSHASALLDVILSNCI